MVNRKIKVKKNNNNIFYYITIQLTTTDLIDQRSILYCTGELAPILIGNRESYDE